MFDSLAIFAIVSAFVVLVILIYFLIKKCPCKKICTKLQTTIKRKLFWSGPIRYIIVGYLKLLNQFANIFLLSLVAIKSQTDGIFAAIFIAFLIAWPIWTLFFLIGNRHILNQKKVMEAYGSLY